MKKKKDEVINTLVQEMENHRDSPDTELCTTVGFYTVAYGDDYIEIVVIDIVGFSVGGSCCKICNN